MIRKLKQNGATLDYYIITQVSCEQGRRHYYYTHQEAPQRRPHGGFYNHAYKITGIFPSDAMTISKPLLSSIICKCTARDSRDKHVGQNGINRINRTLFFWFLEPSSCLGCRQGLPYCEEPIYRDQLQWYMDKVDPSSPMSSN